MAGRTTFEVSVTAAGGEGHQIAVDPRDSPRLLVLASAANLAALQAEEWSTGTSPVKTLQQLLDDGRGTKLEHRDVPWGSAALLLLVGNRAVKLIVRNIGEYAFFGARFGKKEWTVSDMVLLDLSRLSAPLVLALRGSSENQATFTPPAQPTRPPLCLPQKRKQLPPPPVPPCGDGPPPPVPPSSPSAGSSGAKAPAEVTQTLTDLPAMPAAPGMLRGGELCWLFGRSRFVAVQPHVSPSPKPCLSFSVSGGGPGPTSLSVADLDLVVNGRNVVVINQLAVEAARRLAAKAVVVPAMPEARAVLQWRDTGQRLTLKGSGEFWTPLDEEAVTSLPTRRFYKPKQKQRQRQVLLSHSSVESLELHEYNGLWKVQGRQLVHVCARVQGQQLRLVVAQQLLDTGSNGWPLSGVDIYEGLSKAAHALCCKARGRGWRLVDARNLALSYMAYEERVRAARDCAGVPLHLIWQMADSKTAQEYCAALNARCRAAQA